MGRIFVFVEKLRQAAAMFGENMHGDAGKSRCSWEKDEVGNKIGLMSTGPILREAGTGGQ